jgi:predicted nucleic acid-binding protein
MRLTIDTSVFVSRLRASDVSHAASRRFLEALIGSPVIVLQPTLVYPEIAGAVRRFTGDTILARDSLKTLDLLPNLNLIAIDHRLAEEAAHIAAACGMKGGDAVFAAVAHLYDAVLVSLDLSQRERCPASVRALSPEEATDKLAAVR